MMFRLDILLLISAVSATAVNMLQLRQSISEPACASNCTEILAAAEACGGNSACLCDNSTATQILDCVNCAVQREATPQDAQDDTAALQAYQARCAAVGQPVIPLTIASTSATVPPATTTNQAPGSTSSDTSGTGGAVALRTGAAGMPLAMGFVAVVVGALVVGM